MNRSLAASLVALVALCSFSVPTQAQVLLSGEVEGEGLLTPFPPNSTTTFVQITHSEGDDTILGAFTGESSAELDISNPLHLVSEGTFTENFTDGTLFGTLAGTGKVTSPGVGTFDTVYTVTGGSGRFLGATGDILITTTVLRTSLTGFTAAGTYVGSLSVPEPGSIALLLGLGLSGAGLCRRQRRSRQTAARLSP